MKIKSIVIDFKKTKVFEKEKGVHCIIYKLYFIRIWLLDDTILEMVKKSHDAGLREARQIYKN